MTTQPSTTYPLSRGCPCCKKPLKKLILQQGATGGWISIAAHLKKCRFTPGNKMTPETADCLSQLEATAAAQCARLAIEKAERKAEQPARRAAAKEAAEVPWFIAQKRKSQPQIHTPAGDPQVCDTCHAEFAPNDTTSCQQHAAKCAMKRQAQIAHYEDVLAATNEKARVAEKRVEAVERIVAKAKATLKAKADAVEDEKRRQRAAKGKKNKTKKKFAYHEPHEEPEPEMDECTLHECLQRIKEAEKLLKDARNRAAFRVETAEIAAAEAEGVIHPACKQRAADGKAKAHQKKLDQFKKLQKRKSKGVLSEERKEKSLGKAKRRASADTKYQRAEHF